MSETVIRRAVAGDVRAIAEMGIRFYLLRNFRAKGFQLNTSGLEAVLLHLLDSNGLIVVAERDGKLVGSVLGLISPWIGDVNQLVVQEIWWWVNEECQGEFIGKRMIRFYEEEARRMGVTFSIVGTHEFDGEDKLGRVYERLGYRHLQHDFIKEL